MILGNVRVRSWWNPKSRIFKPPSQAKPPLADACDTELSEIMMSKINLTENIPPPPQ
jgi:hypothetical protein